MALAEQKDPAQVALTRDVARFLDALARLIDETEEAAERARDGIGHHAFEPYYALRNKTTEFQAMLAVVEGRIARLGRHCPETMSERLDELERAMLGLLVRASVQILFALSAIPLLPLGIRELFAGELRLLHETKEKLKLPKHAGKLGADIEMDVETAELILLEVMEKAPSLLSFDA